MSAWLQNLRLAFDSYPVVVLHGNVRDWYLDQDGHLHRNLTSLLRKTLVDPTVFGEILVYGGTLDGGEGTRESLSQDEPGREVPDSPPTGGLLQLERIRPKADASALPPIPRNFFEIVNREFRQPSPRRMALVHYLDKMVKFHAGGASDPEERQCLYFLERAIENMYVRNRLVMVALTDSRIPVEIYTNSPKVRLVEIPVPDAEDRLRFARTRLGGWERDDLQLVADLTAGVYIQQLEEICQGLLDLAAGGPASPRAVREVVNRIRIGVRKDHWADLDIQTLDDASRRVGRTADKLQAMDPGGLVSDRAKAFDGIKGQDEAVGRVLESLILARTGLTGVGGNRNSRPKGVLFFAGPSGVGKTLLAKRTAQFLFGSEDAFIRLDMSEYKEEHSVSKLIGSPPGYVGFERGGALTNAVREHPFSVILFDEIEKAHTKVLDVFLQIFDDGRLTDSRGQVAYFTESIIVLTSNLGTRKQDSRDHPCDEWTSLERILKDTGLDPERRREQIAAHFVQSVENFFRFEISRPELLNRIGSRIVPFSYIDSSDVQSSIVEEHLRSLRSEFDDRHRARGFVLQTDTSVAKWLVSRYGDRLGEFGGRGIANAIEDHVNVPLARQVLRQEFKDARGIAFVCEAKEAGIDVKVVQR